MSMHKITLTQIEESGLKAHGLKSGEPSQVADCFRQGVAWGSAQYRERLVHLSGEMQALRNHVEHWARAGIDAAPLARADDALREYGA
jgi:hypothetical protein